MANEEYLNNFNSLYDKFYAKLNQPAVEYKPQSLSTLKDALTKVIRPSYDKQIGNVKKSSAEGRASISADAGRRGLGSSTVVSDLLNRNKNAEAENINNINSDYLAALYSALMNQKNAQDEMSMSAQQANAQARQNASSQALGLAQNAYDKVYAPTSTGGGGGGRRGGGGGGGGGETPIYETKDYQDALKKLKSEGYSTKSAVGYIHNGTALEKVNDKKQKDANAQKRDIAAMKNQGGGTKPRVQTYK